MSRQRYLLPGETTVITVRKHPAVLAVPLGWTAGLFALAVAVSATGNGPASAVAWIAVLGGLGYLAWRLVIWATSYFTVTSTRFILVTGIIARNVAMMPLARVTDMTYKQSVAGRALGYGTFVIESAGQDQALSRVDHIPYPDQLYLEVCALVFPQRLPDGGDGT